MKELEAMGVSQMLIVDPMSIYYLTGVYNDPHERFYGLLLKKDGNHIYFLNKLFSIHEDVGAQKVWYSDTDPAMEIVAQYLDKDAPLGVDKDLKARFLLPLMEQNPYNIIAFQTDVYTDYARLEVKPTPDTTIRVFMAWKAADSFVKLPEQELTAPDRNGFTVIEWGGTQLP